MKKTIIIPFSLAMVFLSSCTSTKKKVAAGQPYTSEIQWPEDYNPAEAGFFVHNEIEIDAPQEKVWEILMQAETWPDWYEGASNVKVIDSENGLLQENGVFTWKTMGLEFKSTIKEFEPYSRLSWESVKKSIQGYHAWLLVPTENGCRLITQESQKGFLTFLEKTFQPKKLEKLHQIWLEEIKKKAEGV